MVPPTSSNKLRTRTTAITWVESERFFFLPFNNPKSSHDSNSFSSKRAFTIPYNNSCRNSLKTEKSKPGSSRARPRMHYQSIRLRTASAACRSDRYSKYCIMIIKTSLPGLSTGCPSVGYRSFKVSLSKMEPSGTLSKRYILPLTTRITRKY
jgi:hypothetical protein